ncbi:hypothetical protein VI817_001149 [Penicillium citrinum]|nr:hypothetical protein VI817_001149 [Penicillium citrinum]
MPAPTTTLLIEGSFSELAEEFANYVDSIRKEGSLQSEIAPLLQPIRQQEQAEGEPDRKQYDEVLKKIVASATALNGAPEKGELGNKTNLAKLWPRSFIEDWARVVGKILEDEQKKRIEEKKLANICG